MAWILLLLAIAALGALRFSNRVNVDHLPQRFVVFGLVTTGSDPGRHEIIEIGAMRVDRDATEHESFRCLVRPAHAIPYRVTELTGITQSALELDGKRMVEALREFNSFIGDLPLVSFNAELGMNFLGKAAQKNAVLIKNPVACARKMAHRAWPARKGDGLSELARAKDENSDADAVHSVLEDCRRALTVYRAAASRLGTTH